MVITPFAAMGIRKRFCLPEGRDRHRRTAVAKRGAPSSSQENGRSSLDLRIIRRVTSSYLVRRIATACVQHYGISGWFYSQDLSVKRAEFVMSRIQRSGNTTMFFLVRSRAMAAMKTNACLCRQTLFRSVTPTTDFLVTPELGHELLWKAGQHRTNISRFLSGVTALCSQREH